MLLLSSLDHHSNEFVDADQSVGTENLDDRIILAGLESLRIVSAR